MTLPPGRVKACTECRQQKQRCDAYLNYDLACSRCKKFDLECVITNQFQRRKKRTKRELQREIDLLKNQIGLSSRPSVREGMDEEDEEADENIKLDDVDVSHPMSMEVPLDGDTPAYESPEKSHLSHASHPESAADNYLPHKATQSPTLSQSLIDVTVEAKEIDDCFSLFNQHYTVHLPGLFDPAITPNKRFQQSPFLFWTIVCTGSRRYAANPRIYTQLSKRMIGFVLSSLISSARPIPAIQAVILLCSWPVPTTSIFHDPAHALAGAALNLATQNGLHVLCREVEFSKRPRKQGQEILQLQGQPYEKGVSIDGEIIFRLRLWTHCLITFQHTSMCDGLPFAHIPGPTELAAKSVLRSVLDPFLYFRYQLHSIQTGAITTIVRSVRLEASNGDGDETLTSLIDIFDAQLVDIDVAAHDDKELASLMAWTARLSIRMFYFFLKASPSKLKSILRAGIAACEVIEHIWHYQSHHNGFVPHMSHYIGRMLMMAAFTLMRTMRSASKDMFQPARSETAFNRAIAMAKAFAVQKEDLSDVAVRMIEQLRGSTKAFIQEDGTNTALELKLRGRLFMSVVFDCFWWWRAEFDNLSKVKQDQPCLQQPTPSSESTLNVPSLSPGDLEQLCDLQNQIYEPLLDDGFFSDMFMDPSAPTGLVSMPLTFEQPELGANTNHWCPGAKRGWDE